jgi:hypothetical protein
MASLNKIMEGIGAVHTLKLCGLFPDCAGSAGMEHGAHSLK